MFDIDKIIIFGILIYAFSSAISIAGAYLGIFIVLISFIIKLIKDRDFRLKKTGLEFPVFLFVLANIISVIFSNNISISFDFFVNKVGRYIIIFYLLYYSLTNLEIVNKVNKVFILSISIASLYSTYQHFFLGKYRASGFISTLTYGSILIFIMPLLINFLVSNKYKIIYYLVLILTISSLIFTNTRGAWLGFIVVILLTGIKYNIRLIYCFVILSIILLIFMPSFTDRVLSIVDVNNSSNNERIFIWKSAFNMFKNSPITGIGPGMFKEMYTDYVLEGARVSERRYAHSNIMNTLAETGVIGLFSYLFLLYSIFKQGYHNYKRIDDYYWSNNIFSILVGLVAFFIHGLTFTNFVDSETVLLFWVMTAILFFIINENIELPTSHS